MKIDKIIEGKHNNEAFRFADGLLNMFGRSWHMGNLKTLFETANLLKLEGYEIKTPKRMKTVVKDSLWNGTYEVEEPEFED